MLITEPQTEEDTLRKTSKPADEPLITSTVTLPDSMWELLRSVAWKRRTVGRPSVSSVIRELVLANEAKLRAELKQG